MAPELITRREALSRYTPDHIRAELDAGRWRRPFRGIYAIGPGDLDDRTRIAAALLATVPGAVVVRESAAILHGFGVLSTPDVHIGSTRTLTARRTPGLALHATSLTAADLVVTQDILCTSPVRTAIDLARLTGRLDAIAVLDVALRSGSCTPESLQAELHRQRHLRGIVQARALTRLADPRAESPMESRTRLRVLDDGLPAPQLQIPVGPYRLDLGWEEFRVGVEYDGIDHLQRARQRWDLERRRYLTAAGWTILWVTDVDVYLKPRQFLAQLRLALRRAA